MKFLCKLGLVACASLCSVNLAWASDYTVQIHGQLAGKQLISTADGATMADYSYTDRGRGEHIHARWTLDAQGLPLSYQAEGNDYWKTPLKEEFKQSKGRAHWNSRSEHGEQTQEQAAFYVPANPPPEFMGVLARALLRAPAHRLPLLPGGEAQLREVSRLEASGRKLIQYQISGMDFMPTPVWLDEHGRTAAVLNDWFEVMDPAELPLLAQLKTAQDEALRAWHAELAQRLSHHPQGGLLIQHARLFDPVNLDLRPGMSVLVRGDRIVRVDSDERLADAPDVERIDAQGRFLMPGLWDVHQHFAGVDGVFDLIAGVTSARDLANDNVPMLERVHRFDAGSELGPRVVLGGIVEGVGPLAGPTDVKVENAEQARAAVDWYARHGYAQIKIYSSFKPELVSLIAEAAHARGMRVSGHVPAFSTAREFVEAGADEIQHLNFILLNFFDDVGDPRGPARYTVAAQRASRFQLSDPRWSEFLAFLKQHHTALDPTMGVLEGLFSGQAGQVAPALRPLAYRFPLVAQRSLQNSALSVPAGQEQVYAQAFPAMLRLFKSLYDAGVPMMPGTDAFAGYSLHRELELYAQAGIPNAEVLRMATLTPAQVLGVAHERGLIAPGRLADMILVDGDPLQNISDIRRVHLTIKGGTLYHPLELETALGMNPP